MISKLVKFEARSTFRLLVIVWAALLAMAIIMGLAVRITGVSAFQETIESTQTLYVIKWIVSAIMWILYISLFVAQIVLTLAIVVFRFYKGLLGDEGYLMHTLPVSTGRLIASKGIIASIAILGSVIAGTLSIMIIAFSFDPSGFMQGFADFGEAIGAEPIIILYIFEGLILVILSAVSGVYQVYASLSIGQLANRHRILISLGVYIGIGMVLSTIGTIFGVMSSVTELGDIITSILEHEYLGPQLIFIVSIVITGITVVLFHFISERLLSRRLNLL